MNISSNPESFIFLKVAQHNFEESSLKVMKRFCTSQKNDLQTQCRCCSGTDVPAQLQQPRCPSDHVSPLLFTTKSPCSLTRTQEWLSEITHVIQWWRFKSKQRSEIHQLNLDWLPEESNEEEETPGWIMWTLKAQFTIFLWKSFFSFYSFIYEKQIQNI